MDAPVPMFTFPVLTNPTQVAAWRGRPLKLLDARSVEEFEAGHLPGATSLDVFACHWADTSPQGLSQFQALMQDGLRRAGIDDGDIVVCYDDVSGMHSARALWTLEYLGQEATHLLDGGLTAWRAAGLPLESGPAKPGAASFTACPRPGLVASAADMAAAIGDPAVAILDTRSLEEHLGARVRAARGGCIPGSVHLEWTRNLTEDGRFKPPGELRALYASCGVDPDHEVMAYCQGGYRAAHSYLALRLAGYPRVRNYLGSWAEWGNRPDLPVETAAS